MNVELFVHGVPNGEDFWGKEEDRNYFGTFYDHSADEVKFLIQTRASKDKIYCYYNYLVYKTFGSQTSNVVANDGRDGSYFGITLRLDEYCKDIANMYRILDTVFNAYVMGKLLKMEKTKLKYTTSNFASVSNVLEGIEKETIQLIQNTFSNDSFTRLDGFVTSGGNYPKYNLYDCTSENVMSSVKQYGRVAVSPFYPSNKEVAIKQQCNSQIQAIQQQHEAQLKANADACAQISTSLLSTRDQVAHLQQENGLKDGTIIQLNDKVSHLQSEIKKMGKSRKVAQIVANIKDPIVELTAILKQIVPESLEHQIPDSTPESKIPFAKVIKFFLPFLNMLLLLVVVGSLLISFKSMHTNDTKINTLIAKVDSLRKGNQDIEKEAKLGTAGNDTPNDAENFNMQLVKINIKDFNGGNLSLNKTYTVEANNGANNGTWCGEGCEISPTEDSKKIKLKPTANNVKIIYCVGYNAKIRDLNAK